MRKVVRWVVAGSIVIRKPFRARTRRILRNVLVVWVAITMVLPPPVVLGTADDIDKPATPEGPTPCNSRGGPCPPLPTNLPGDTCNAGGSSSPLATDFPVYLREGASIENLVDLVVPGPAFDFAVSRSYLSTSLGASSLGDKWMLGAADMHLEVDPADAALYLVVNAQSFFTFTGLNETTIISPLDSTLEATATPLNIDMMSGHVIVDEIEEIHITDRTTDDLWIFYGPAAPDPDWRGKLKERTTNQWHSLSSPAKEGFVYSYDSAGVLTQITSPTGQEHRIDFSYYGSTSFVDKIEVRTAGSPGRLLASVEYTYKQEVSSPSGDIGQTDDLVQVKVSLPTTAEAVDGADTLSIVRYTQYRYDGNSNLTAVYEHDALERVKSAGVVSSTGWPENVMSVDNVDAMADPDLAEFASRSFEYYGSNENTAAINTPFADNENLEARYVDTGAINVDETGFVASETVGGPCSTCGSSGPAARVTKKYYYIDRTHAAEDENEVTRIVIEDTVDGEDTPHHRTVYGLNLYGRLLRRAFISGPLDDPPTYWCDSIKMATDQFFHPLHRIGERRFPSAHNVTSADGLRQFLNPYTYDPMAMVVEDWTNDTATLQGSQGVILVCEYNTKWMRTGIRMKKGSGGAANYVWAANYGDGDGDAPSGKDHAFQTLLIATYDYPVATTDRESGKKTTYSYTFWDANDRQIKTRKTTLPEIGTGENGAGTGTATVSWEYFDSWGRLRWTLDGEGYVDYYSYHPTTGHLAYVARDVDTSSLGGDITGGSSGNWDSYEIGEADDNMPSRAVGLPTALALAYEVYFDPLGRATKAVDADGAAHHVVQNDKSRVFLPYVDASVMSPVTEVPARIVEFADGRQVSATFQAEAGLSLVKNGDDVITGISGSPVYVGATLVTRDDMTGRVKFVDRYHDIPGSLPGSLGANFYRTAVVYDALGRRSHVAQFASGSDTSDSVEQVTQLVYDVRSRVVEVLRGVSDASHDMGTDYDDTPSTLETVRQIEYDAGGIGDGHVTKVKDYHGTGTNDFTGANLKVDFRGHVRGVEPFYMNGSTETPIGPFLVQDFDWQGRELASALFSTNQTWSTVLVNETYAVNTTSNRKLLTETLRDALGRPYRVKRKSSLSTTAHFATDFYYDRNSRTVAVSQKNGAGVEIAYDGVGRAYQRRTVLNLDSASYSSGKFQYLDPAPDPDLDEMADGPEGVLEIAHTVFDGLDAVERHRLELNHDEANSSTPGIDMDDPNYVRRTTHNWFDDADRLVATADLGSGDSGGQWKYATLPSRSGTAPTASSAGQLVELLEYNADTGRLELMTDPAGSPTKYFYDDLGRRTHVASNWHNFDPGTSSTTGDGTDPSRDTVVAFAYNGLNRLETLTALDANADGNSSDDQVTTYLYEDPIGADRATTVIYPDSGGGSDLVTLEYAVDGRVTERVDQRGTTLELTYNGRRQLELMKATALGGADGHIKSIKREYDTLARLSKVTSYENDDGTGTVRNQVSRTNGDFGYVSAEFQSHEGAAVPFSSPGAIYARDTAVDGNGVYQHQLRRQQVIYPSGGIVYFDYGEAEAASASNRLSRVRAIREANSSGDQWAVYDYNGRGRLAAVDLPQIDLKLDYFQGTSGTYAGLDRFGRVKDQFWDGYNSTPDADDFQYTYDYASNRTSRDISSSIYSFSTDNLDQVYTHDGQHRLKTFDEGTLSMGGISSPPREQDWSLDALGNWSGFVVKAAGSPTLDQTRTTNDFNEITDISKTIGDAWQDPAYDAAGNMTTIPQPADLTDDYTATYDAWNRLVKIVDGEDTVAEYEYDGMNRRIVKSVYASGTLDHRLHFYYDDQWRVLQVNKEVDETESEYPLEENVWHPYYVDALATRFYDADTDGNLDEGADGQQYLTHDANFNVTAVTDDAGAVVERYHYSPYGEMQILDANFAADGDGKSDIENRYTYTGREFDAETGLYHYRNRYYHAQLGSFVSRDPIGFAAGDANVYRYVGNGPTDWLDPFGLECPDDEPVPDSIGPAPPVYKAVFWKIYWRWKNREPLVDDPRKTPFEVSQIEWLIGNLYHRLPFAQMAEDAVRLQLDPVGESIEQGKDQLDFVMGLPHLIENWDELEQVDREDIVMKPAIMAGLTPGFLPKGGKFPNIPGDEVPASIMTPRGAAIQANTPEALSALNEIRGGATVYRQGLTGVQNTADGQFWSLSNPATTPGYANQMGMPTITPPPNQYPWIMGGQVPPGTPLITRPAPSIGTNFGGSMEGVVNPGSVRIDWFHMPDVP